MKVLAWVSFLTLTLQLAWAQTLVQTVTVTVAYGFSVKLNSDEPTSAEVGGVSRLTEIFYRRIVASAFALTFNSITVGTAKVEKIDSRSVRVDYPMTITYNTGDAATPTLSQTRTALITGFEPDDYLINFVQIAEPVGTSVFQFAETVALTVTAGTASNSDGGTATDVDTPAAAADACFSGETTVHVQNHGVVLMRDLQVGDLVHVGNQVYSSVYGFGHLDGKNFYQYWQVHTRPVNSDDSPLTPLELSDEHFVFTQGQSVPIRADQLKLKDVLYGSDRNQLYVVTSLRRIERKGAYLPLTAEGTIVASGIFASTYVSVHPEASKWWLTSIVSEQSLFDSFVTPFRFMCGTLGMTEICSHPNMYESETGVWLWLRWGQKLAQTWNGMQAWLWQPCSLVMMWLAFSQLGIRVRMLHPKQKSC